MASLFESNVSIAVSEYQQLVTDSTKLQVIKDLIENDRYVCSKTLHSILGIQQEGGESDDNFKKEI